MDDPLYEMKLHQTLDCQDWKQITRVPGGWIYRFFTENETGDASTGHAMTYTVDSVFVPFNNEFRAKPKASDDDDPWETTEGKTNG